MSRETLLDVAGAAALLGVPCSWIYARVEREDCDLPFFKIGRYLRFKPSELEHYLELQRGGGLRP